MSANTEIGTLNAKKFQPLILQQSVVEEGAFSWAAGKKACTRKTASRVE